MVGYITVFVRPQARFYRVKQVGAISGLMDTATIVAQASPGAFGRRAGFLSRARRAVFHRHTAVANRAAVRFYEIARPGAPARHADRRDREPSRQEWRMRIEMSEDIRQAIRSQYAATLEMLKQAIVKRPDSLGMTGHTRIHSGTSRITRSFTPTGPAPAEADFEPWAKHRAEYNFMGPSPWPPHKEPEIGEPYTQQEILEYHALVREQVEEHRSRLWTWDAASGFCWPPLWKPGTPTTTSGTFSSTPASCASGWGKASSRPKSVGWV